MQVDITARHLEIDDTFKAYANEKINKLSKYTKSIESVRIVFSAEKLDTISEIIITGKNMRITASGREQDIRASFDLCFASIEKQLKKVRGKIKHHKIKRFLEGFRRFSGKRHPLPEPKASIIKTESFARKPMSAEEAALELDAFDKEFIVFRNSEDDKINVIYKRKDGNYGLIET